MGVFVFGYGSLMWNPGFRPAAARAALLDGWRRAWCVKSTFYRGCDKTPGLVLGLKRGGSCVGILFEIEDEHAEHVLAELDRREMRERGYVRQTLMVQHAGGRAEAVAYTSDELPDPVRSDFDTAYKAAKGVAGPTSEYIDRTREFVRRIAVPDHWPTANDGLPEGVRLWETRSGCAGGLPEALT
jgi:cation transport protein ChaC